jgi:hypothetical protein
MAKRKKTRRYSWSSGVAIDRAFRIAILIVLFERLIVSMLK